jgi:putative MATE family efflux protein
MDKTKELGQKPIGQLLAKYSIPAVIAMLVNAIYNVVDRIFIGQFSGESALAALTVVFPMMMIVMAFAGLVGAGGGALLAIKLGEEDVAGANHVFGNTFSFGVLVIATLVVVLQVNLESALMLFGATPDILADAVSYMRIILMGSSFQMIGFVLNSTVRTEGKPIFSMVSMIVAAVTNIILDYIFIGLLGMGVVGAAFATIAGQFVGLGILLTHYLGGKSQLKLKTKDLMPDIKVVSQVLTIGFATFISTIGTSVAMTFINRSLAIYGGLAAVTSMGAINSLFTFFIMPIMGITQGMQPIIGYNYGAKKQERSVETLKYGLIVGGVFSTIIFALLQIYPEVFVGLFLAKGSATIQVAVNGLRIYIAVLPFVCLNLMGVAYFQSTAKGKMSMVLGMLRQFIFLIPLVLILPGMLGINGVWLSVPIADALAIIVTACMLFKDAKEHTPTKKVLSNAIS